MALDTFVAGAYLHTFNGVSTGLSEDGYDLDQQVEQEEITGDYYGRSVIETVAQGGNIFLQFNSLAYKAGSVNALYPFATLGEMGTPGLFGSDIAKASVMSGTSGTSAASSVASLTASKSIVAPGHNAQLKFQSKLKKVPIRLRLLPYITNVVRWYQLA